PLLVRGQIQCSKNNIPKGDLHTEIAPVSKFFVVRELGGVMPAMRFRSVEEIVQPPAFHIAAAVRKIAVYAKGARDNDRNRVEADNSEQKTSQDIPERPLERVGNEHIRDLYMGYAVMIAVKFP